MVKYQQAKAEQDIKQWFERFCEFFGALDFLVTFLAMKKVTLTPTLSAQRDSVKKKALMKPSGLWS